MRILEALRKHVQRARDRAELMQMDDAMLFDLGIERHEIEQYLDGTHARSGSVVGAPLLETRTVGQFRVIEGGLAGPPALATGPACC